MNSEQDRTSRTPARDERYVYSVTVSRPWFYLPGLCLALFAWLVPDNVLSRYPWIQHLASKAGFASLLERHAAASAFPEVTYAGYALLLVFVALHSTGAAVRFFSWRHVPPYGGKKPVARILLERGTVGLLLAIAGAYGTFWLPGDPGFCHNCTTHSRFGFGVLLGIVGYALPTIVGITVWCFSALLSLNNKYDK